MKNKKLLLDENVPRSSQKLLESLGYMVRHILDVGRSEKDFFICDIAIDNSESIITFDKDFLYNLKKEHRSKVNVIYIKVLGKHKFSSEVLDVLEFLHSNKFIINLSGILVVEKNNNEFRFWES